MGLNAVQDSINRVKREIPKAILEDCFMRRDSQYRLSPKTVEQAIRDEVILKMVLPDCNIRNGVYTYVPLANAKFTWVDDTTMMYEIPKENTGYRSIMTALQIMFIHPYTALNYSMNHCGNSMINRSTNALLDSLDGPVITSNARVELIGENTIIVYHSARFPVMSYLQCILENDDELSNIKPRSITYFRRLIILAVKAYIYNEMILDIDKAKLIGGHELGKYREIVESYSDAQELYQQLLDEKIGKIFYMNGKENMARHIKLSLGGLR